MSEIILETSGLTKEFRGFVAVKNVDLKIRRGTIHALIGPNGAGKTHRLQSSDQVPDPERRVDPFKGKDITRHAACRHRAIGAGALVPDLGRVPAPERAGERPRGAAAPAGHQLSVLALRIRCWRPCTTRARELIDAVDLDRLSRACRRRAALWPQAGAGDRHHAGARSGDDAARRADGRHGPRGHRAHRRADPHAWRPSRTVLMVEHNLSVVADLSDTITVLRARRDPGRRTYDGGSRDPAGHAKPTWGRDMPEGSTTGTALLEIEDLHAWYGEIHVLHGVGLRRARRRSR